MRHIDADKLYKETKTKIKMENSQGLAVMDDEFLDLIDNAPTADVVPKSEVDRLETEIRLLTENSISAKYPCRVLCSKGLILTKSLEEYDKLLADISSEVAREIFEEIEDIIKNWEFDHCSKETGYFVRKSYNGTMIVKCLTDLKNKYTESEGKK